MKRSLILFAFLALVVLSMAVCGGGGGGGGLFLPPADGGGGGGGGGGGTTPPVISGFDFTLATGNFWEYRWDYDYSDSEGGSDEDAGRFWVVLGPEKVIQGITAYEVQIYGKSKKNEDNGTRSFGPKWKYAAISNNQVLGSTDGVTLKPIFDAQTGKWPGGGFFTSFPGSLIIAQNGTINSANPYISGPAIVAGRSANQSLCEWIAGEYICTGSYSQSLKEYEYYRIGIGPVGYYYSNSTYISDPPPMVFNWEHNVGLTASSFTGQTNPLTNESEPNDGPFTADTVSIASPAIGVVSQSNLANLGNTVIYVWVVDDSGGSVYITPTVEDWYSFTLTPGRVVTITLSFEGSPTADLDLFLRNSSGALMAYGVHDNPARDDQNESIRIALPAGTYQIGVDGYLTPAGPANYTLQIE